MIQNGVDPDAKNNYSRTPIHCAVLKSNYLGAEMLINQMNCSTDVNINNL